MKKVLVIGLGASGLAVVKYFLNKGVEVVSVDRALKKGFDLCPIYLDDHEFEVFDFDLVVVSPGVCLDNVICRRALAEGVELIGEAELALREMKDNKIVGITGSNGKSTTVMRIVHILNQNGRRARALGNIGTPLISVVDKIEEDEIIVAELSSFQLEMMKTKVFDLAMILNVTPNHLDRHVTMENYFLAKRKIGECVKEGGRFAIEGRVVKEYSAHLNKFSYLVLREDLMEFVKLACKEFGLSDKEIFEGDKSFKSLPHRLEFVGDIRGVHCYNDSKATTMEAVSYAVKTLRKDIILIAGGRHKGGSFSVWNESFPKKVKAIILLGEAKNVIAAELELNIPIYLVDSLDEAIEKGLQLAVRGDNLILSPGCSSYDMFTNFEKRGEAYKRGLENESKRYDPDCSSC